MEKNYFSKLSNNLFYNIEGEFNLLNKCNYDYKVLLVLDYLYTNTNRRNITIFSLEDIITINGYKPDTHKNKINDKFKDILIKLQELKIIETDIDLKKIKSKELIRCNVHMFVKDKEGNDIRFIQLFDTEKDKIIAYNKENIDNLKLLYYYCYLKARMYKRQKDNDLIMSGGRAEICYPSYSKINDDIGITDEVIKKYNDILVELNLIRIGNAGLYYYQNDKNKISRESPNIYTLYTEVEEVWQLNLKEGIKFYKEQYADERVFKDTRMYKNNDKKINGYINRIEYLESIGKANSEQIEKKNSYKESVNINEEMQRRITLFNKKENKGMILSEIFDSYGNDKKFEQAYKLEKDLGLLNAEDDLAIDYDYYKWVMINYSEHKKDYYRNCIKKHIEENNSTLKTQQQIDEEYSKKEEIFTDDTEEDCGEKSLFPDYSKPVEVVF
jgi:hypothetical protein